MKPIFSVLIPIYNVKKYLAHCLNSILDQSLKDLQIICINDGSTDGSTAILNEYAKKDPRIFIINQENKGYGAALNHGIQHIQADYISIIEPDDFLAPNAYENFYNDTLCYPQVDIIKYAYWNFNEHNKKEFVTPSNSSQLNLPDKPFKISQYPQLLLYHPSVWSCVYRTSFFKKKRLSFVEAPGAGWTDNPFFIASMCFAQNILWKNKRVYYYRQGHPTASSNLVDCRIPILRLIDILDFIEGNNIQDFGILLCIYKRIFSYINIVRENTHYLKDEVEPLIQNVLSRIDPNIVYTEFFCTQEQGILQNNEKENQ